MIRTAVQPKWLALLALATLLAIAFVQLGRWQLGIAHDRARVEAIEAAGRQPVVDVTSLLTPHTRFPAPAGGRMVTATGTYDEGQVLVAGRLLAGTRGYWVLTPLRLTDTAALLPVLRGWTEQPTLPDPPAGQVQVTASLAPGESPAEGVFPAGQLGSVDLAQLVNRWPGDLYNAFGFAQREQSAGAIADPAPLTHVPPPRPDTGLNWRNAAYALQWWVFAAFAFVMWVKMVQADHRGAGVRRGPQPPVIPDPERVSASKQEP